MVLWDVVGAVPLTILEDPAQVSQDTRGSRRYLTMRPCDLRPDSRDCLGCWVQYGGVVAL